MARQKRDLRKGFTIRKLFEDNGVKYIMVSNKIMELYQQGYQEYIDKKSGEIKKRTFDSRDLALYIGIEFLNRMEFWGYLEEIDYFTGMSMKRIEPRLEKLEQIELPMNNHLTKTGENELLATPRNYPLVKKHRDRGFERNRTVKTYRWYTPFDCDKKAVKNPETKETELQSINYFMVTVYDYDLFVNKILDADEFALYLYLVQCYDSSSEEGKGIPQSARKIAENLNVKNVDVMQRRLNKLIELRIKDRFCPDDKTFPLIQTTKPNNFNTKLVTRQEPSLHYYPVYNDKTIENIRNEAEKGKESAKNKPDIDSNKMDSEFKVDSDLHKKDSHLNKKDTDIPF
ncbi:hypothetical protein [Metabacillus halosaccharovorans]|uniref:hypothetical protein n=1 Tax=Metabacillus halosaccharovorans TaxID=930124 RepID=UPI00203B25FF|nr:hypothetical protein [Metabacillus halosaccharovorans]MCM3444361.1 hypothetical protein [Metabacillus halosaccharovorans]